MVDLAEKNGDFPDMWSAGTAPSGEELVCDGRDRGTVLGMSKNRLRTP